MQRILSALADAATKRARVIVILWLVATAVILVAAHGVSPKSGGDAEIPGTDSAAATALLEEAFPSEGDGSGGPIVLHTESGELPQDAASDVARALAADPIVASAAPGQRSEDGRTQLVTLDLSVQRGDLTVEQAEQVLQVAEEAAGSVQVEAAGVLGQTVGRESRHTSELIGIAAAIVILLAVGGTVPSMLVPIGTALIGVLVALRLLALIGSAVSLPTSATTLATMIGLGVGIDYALFLLARIRGMRAAGATTEAAVRGAMSTTGSAILFAAATVALALGALSIPGLAIVTKLGFSAALAVVIAVLAALTLLPALVMLLGDRLESLALRRRPPVDESEGWARWGRWVVRRPRRALVASLALLLLLAAPTVTLELGSERPSDKPEGTTERAATDLIAAAFGPGTSGPATVVAQLPDAKEPTRDAQAEALREALAATPGVQAVSPPRWSTSGDVVSFTVTPTSEPGSEATAELIDELRSSTLPAALPPDATAHVGGPAAQPVDLADRIGAALPVIVGAVVALAFVLLVVAFRSIVLPLKAAALNLLSVGAAYGVLTLVFQHGWGAELIGLDGAVPIVSFVPMLMFAILFGLSMDYEVFLLSRVQEHHLAGAGDEEAIVRGLAATGRLITAAAAIMVAVFASFLLDADPTIKMFGLGLAVAILIDATLVRCLLVPAAMVLMGGANWWLPHWIDRRLPRIQID